MVRSIFSECGQETVLRCKNKTQRLESGSFWTILVVTQYGFPVILFEDAFSMGFVGNYTGYLLEEIHDEA